MNRIRLAVAGIVTSALVLSQVPQTGFQPLWNGLTGAENTIAAGQVIANENQQPCPFGAWGTRITDPMQTKQLADMGLISVSITANQAIIVNKSACHIENQAGFRFEVFKIFYPMEHPQHYTGQQLVHTYGPLGAAPGWQIELPGFRPECAAQFDVGVGASGPHIAGIEETGKAPLCPLSSTNNGVCEVIALPTVIQAGTQFQASFRVTNTGTKTWIAGSGLNRHMLMSASPSDNTTWGTSRISLPGNISANQSATIGATLVAPAAAGTYTLAFEMGEEGVERFGSVCARTVTVTGYNPPSSSSSSYSSNPYADVVISKTGPSTANRGSTLTYGIAVTNNGTVAAQNVIFTDNVPSGLTFSSGMNSGCTLQGNTISCSVGTVQPGQTISGQLLFSVPYSGDNCVTSTVTNIAYVTTSTQESNTGNNQSQQVSTQLLCNNGGTSTFTLTKTDNRTTVNVNEDLNYEIRITNNSSTSATNVTMTDVLPSWVTYISSSDSGYNSNQVVTWNNLSIPANSTKTVYVVARVRSDAPQNTVLTNTAYIGNLTAVDVTTVTTGNNCYNCNYSATIDISDYPDPVRPRELLTYTLRVTNKSSGTRTLRITHILPNEVDYLSSTDSGFERNGTVEWDRSFSANETRYFNVTVRVDNTARDGDRLNTSAYVDNASDQEVTTVRDDDYNDDNDRRIRITITDSPDPVEACKTLNYTLAIRNNESSSRTVDVYGHLDPDTTFLSASHNGTDYRDDEVRWNNIFVNRNSTTNLTLRVKVDCGVRTGDTLRLRATVDNEEDTETTRITSDRVVYDGDGAAVSLMKQADRSEASPGTEVSYAITIHNTSAEEVRDVRVEDSFPSSQLSIIDPGTGQVSGSVIRWNIGTLAPDETRSFSYRARLSGHLRNGDVVTNTVRVTGGNLDSYPTAMAQVTILQQLPQTGVDDYTGPLHGSFLLRPLDADAAHVPAIAWSSLILMAVSIGSRVGRKYLL